MEKKYKVGDKVRFNSDWGSYRFEDSLTKGEVVEISDITDCGSIYVRKYVEASVTDDEIELVEQDPKTAFLTELKELMEKYNAKIDIPLLDYDTLGFPDVNVEITLGEAASQINICYPCMKEKSITPSSIFDYDK